MHRFTSLVDIVTMLWLCELGILFSFFNSIYLNDYNSTENHESISLVLTMSINARTTGVKRLLYVETEKEVFSKRLTTRMWEEQCNPATEYIVMTKFSCHNFTQDDITGDMGFFPLKISKRFNKLDWKWYIYIYLF